MMDPNAQKNQDIETLEMMFEWFSHGFKLACLKHEMSGAMPDPENAPLAFFALLSEMEASQKQKEAENN